MKKRAYFYLGATIFCLAAYFVIAFGKKPAAPKPKAEVSGMSIIMGPNMLLPPMLEIDSDKVKSVSYMEFEPYGNQRQIILVSNIGNVNVLLDRFSLTLPPHTKLIVVPEEPNRISR